VAINGTGSNTQTYGVQMERVRPKLPELFETGQSVARRIIKKFDASKISTWTAGSGAVLGFRIPLEQYRGGDFGTFSLDNGDLGTGSMPTFQYMTIAYFPLRLNYLLPALTRMATATPAQATVNVFKKTMKDAMNEFVAYEDCLAHTQGDGILATGSGTGAAPGATNPVYNLEPNFGPQRLRLYQIVDIYSNDGTVLRGTGLRVLATDPVAKTATLQGTVTAPTNADNLAVAGMSPPLAVGSNRLGIYTFQSSASSGSTLGLSRTTVPEMVTPNVTASATLAPSQALLVKDYLIQRRDADQMSGLQGISHQAQRAAAFFTGDAITEFQVRESKIPQTIDRVPENSGPDDDFTFGTVRHLLSKRANRSRIDWLQTKNWGRVNLDELDYYKTSDGRYIFENRTSSGTVATADFFSLVSTDNVFCADPGCGAIIQALTLPTGY
jgi:hypothetical protein